ncbi:type 4a pilus biogenesis protein PilO [Herbaspirillum sp. alder98]|uniref:type 4a pilus biogenesis protein PilO n=1 Tax=Herbaspirillum sp. alder98 TaxID=2913096 RepID=UPI001CD8D53B|nr:hypothetical protein [Herbaspirillum sp. alder98]MCA1324196.1 hypothetical protein [Herbaspirillum sp. alder98]
MNHPGNWPLLPRVAVLTLASLCCAGAGLVLHAQPLSTARSGHENQLQAIKAEFHDALQRSASLPKLQARSEQLSARLQAGATLAPEDPANEPLQVRLGATAEQCGLTLEAFRPLTDGAELGVAGDYAALLLFVAELSQPPQPLLFESLDISAQRTATQQGLLMKASVRYQSLSAASNQEPAQP